MRFTTGQKFRDMPAKAVTVLGMSGVGKTSLSQVLQREDWFQYSVDYRIGTRYMDEHIVDNFKREAMKNPFLRGLLRSDSIYIRSNITFDNLSPLSTYLGKPGDPAKGGIPFVEYKRRQNEHREAEVRALMDVPEFIRRATEIYQYPHFICDSGGSLCEVVNPHNPNDPVLKALSENSVLLYIEGTPEHVRMLVDGFRKYPKPMYYQPEFLDAKWAEYKNVKSITSDNAVDPDDFAVWGFEQLIHHRIPLYAAIAGNFGYRIPMREIPAVRSASDFIDLVAQVIDRR
jgi:GTPase SAR1 family protein